MFYNSYRSTKSALQRRQNSFTSKNTLLNQPKRQKLKDLLMTKFIQKYNIKDPDDFLEVILTKFVQAEKLNDIDLKRLDHKIKRLSKEYNYRAVLKSDLESGPQSQNQTLINNVTEINNEKSENNTLNQELKDNNISDNIKEIKNKNKQNQLRNIKADYPTLTTYSNQISKTESNFKKRGCSSYSHYTNKNIRTPEEELAELENEFKEEELLDKKNKYRRIDFSSQGDEWSAIVNYNKNLYQRQLLEEKIKDKEIKKRTKEYLDLQIKEKLKKELEEKNKEKEFDENMKKFNQSLDEIDQIKARKISEQIRRLKNDRDVILKAKTVRDKIEKLKDKKFERNLVKIYKEQIAQDKKAAMTKREKGKEDLMKAKKELEEKHKIMKEKIEKEIEEDKKINKERYLIDQRKEYERNSYYQKFKSLGNKYKLPQAKKVLERIEKEKKETDDKIQHFYEEKNKKEFEKENKARLKRINDKIEIKKFLDMQIAEKNKEKNFLKLLDREQARIWKLDLKKRNEEMKKENEHIKIMNRKNFEFILKQIEQNKGNKLKKNFMTEDEYAMNRDLLEKANEDYLKTTGN